MKTSAEIRAQFLKYFEERQHLIVQSAPIIAKDDPTLMFNNSGMAQFKDNFLGIKPPKSPRIADTQKCLRASGKHNDLDDVGHDTYHHTMFEMLGNWSFGDYYKSEAIAWAWDLLHNVYGLPKDDIYVTIFGGDAEDKMPEDLEALEEWKRWVDEDHILRGSKKDNFWEMGDTGPCGPCSELHVDLRSPEEKAAKPGRDLVNNDHPQVVEIWNLVFMEFNRKADKSLESLPAKNVDTGMGFERLCMALQGKKSNYDTDLFRPYIDYMEREFGCKYGRSEEESIAMRVVMDHIRSISFCIADGQVPSNSKAGYVVRRILRRASRYGFQFLGRTEPFLYQLVDVLSGIYADVFPEVAAQRNFIKRVIEEEEKSFLRTLDHGTKLFDNYVREHRGSKEIDGEFAFKLYDTFGFPVDLTKVMAKEKGWTVDEKTYERLLEEQKRKGREDSERKMGDWVEVNAIDGMPVFIGYENTEGTAKIARYRTIETAKGLVYQIVLDRTPFYAESGGQVGDTGYLRSVNESIRVIDTKKENDLIIHVVEELPEKPAGEWSAVVDAERRRLIRANHSATHLVHAALRKVLGTHVEQKGSLVAEKSLRFDFSHFQKVTDAEIAEVERIVNAKIAEGVQLNERRNVPIAEARTLGAMMLFGEKYGDAVRVITFDPKYSVELCGGCHVQNTSEIRLFKIVSEGSIQTGVRRIEAVTSDGAIAYMEDKLAVLDSLTGLLRNPQDPSKALEALIEQNRKLEKDLQKLQAAAVGDLKDGLLQKAKTVGALLLINEVVEVPSDKELKTLAFDLRKGLSNAVIVLGAVFDGKPMLNVVVTEDLEKAGKVHAGNLVREIAKEIQGGGGGQPFFASAGGKDASGIGRAVAKAAELLG
ncbi:MAG: alanine--tRNA ligase [Bacteroidia bacterium]